MVSQNWCLGVVELVHFQILVRFHILGLWYYQKLIVSGYW